jgi:hypothetical protein
MKLHKAVRYAQPNKSVHRNVRFGQSRHFGRRPTTSVLLLETDIVRVGRHVSKVPIADLTQLSRCRSFQIAERRMDDQNHQN